MEMIPRCRICGSIMRVKDEDGNWVCRDCTIEEIMNYFLDGEGKGESIDSNRDSTRDKTTEG